MGTRKFAEFRSTLLEPAAVKILSRKEFKSNITEKMVKFKSIGKDSKGKPIFQVINPGPRRAYKMFANAFKTMDGAIAEAVSKVFGKLSPDDFANPIEMEKSISRFVRHIGESIKREVLRDTPVGKSKPGVLIKRPIGSRVKEKIEIVKASDFGAVKSSGMIGVVVVGKALHTFNTEEGIGKDEVLGTIKLPKAKRRRKTGAKKRTGGRRRGKK